MIRTRVTNKIPQLRLNVSDGARGVARFGAEEVVKEARLRALVRTGFLRNSIKMSVVNQYRADAIVEALYGPFVEFGTSRMASHPFFIPAAEAVRDDFLKQARRALSVR